MQESPFAWIHRGDLRIRLLQGIPRKGDLVILMPWTPLPGAVGVSDSDGKGTPGFFYAVCQPKPGLKRYYYAFIPFVNIGDALQWILALPHVAFGNARPISAMKLSADSACHSLEQAAIVRFLDWATWRLERAIRAKRKVIALLHEARNRRPLHCPVTRGLDPACRSRLGHSLARGDAGAFRKSDEVETPFSSDHRRNRDPARTSLHAKGCARPCAPSTSPAVKSRPTKMVFISEEGPPGQS